MFTSGQTGFAWRITNFSNMVLCSKASQLCLEIISRLKIPESLITPVPWQKILITVSSLPVNGSAIIPRIFKMQLIREQVYRMPIILHANKQMQGGVLCRDQKVLIT